LYCFAANKSLFAVSKQDTTEEIRSRKSKKNRQCNGQKKWDKKTNNNIQNTTKKGKDYASRTPEKTRR